MELTERILYKDTHKILITDKNAWKWVSKKILITQDSLMIFGQYSSVFEFCDCKILISDHDTFTVTRDQFIKRNIFNKKAVASLDYSNKFITVFLNIDYKNYHLISSSLETQAADLTRALKVASCYQNLKSMARKQQKDLEDFYLKWFTQTCIKRDEYFELGQEDFYDRSKGMYLRIIFSVKEIVKNLRVKGVKLNDKYMSLLNGLLLSMDECGLEKLEIIDCKIDDGQLQELSQGIIHNKRLKHLRFSGTKLTNDSLVYLSNMLKSLPFLEFFHLNRSKKLTGQEHIDTFLISIFENLRLNTLDLSHNNLQDTATDLIIMVLFKRDFSDYFSGSEPWLKTLDFSYNRFTIKENYMMYKTFQKSELMKQDVHLNLQPYPIYKPLVENLVEDGNKVLIAFERTKISIHEKRQLLTIYDMKKVKELSEEISMSILMQKTIEGISKLCERIDNLDFEFPPQYVEKLRELMREILQSSFKSEDFYSFQHALEASTKLAISKRELNLYEDGILEKVTQFSKKIQKLFNIKEPVKSINKLLDNLVIGAIHRDLRGPAIDLLFYLKEKRDEAVNILRKKGIGSEEIEMEIWEKNPYFILEYDDNFAEKTKNMDNLGNGKDILGMHPRWVNYENLSKVTRNFLFESANQKVRSDKDDVSKYKIKRAFFMLSQPSTEIYSSNKADKLLRIAKTICRYRWFKGFSGIQVDDPVEKAEYLASNVARVQEIESEKIQTARDFIKTERQMLHMNRSSRGKFRKYEIDPITENVKKVREKELHVISHPLDVLQGVSSSSIQKIPLNLELNEYSLGMTINAYILKICGLNTEKLTSSLIGLIKKLLEIGRGIGRLEKGNGKVKTEFIVGEIYLNLIKFINTNKTNPKRSLLTNAVNLIALISYFLKMEKDTAFYAVTQFHSLIYEKLEEENYGTAMEKIKFQSSQFFANTIDTLECMEFVDVMGLKLPPDDEMLELFFAKESSVLEFEVKILASKKLVERVRCHQDKYVFEFIDDIMDIKELFEEFNLDKHTYWLFLETNDSDLEDIPLNFDWTMRRVHHLQIYLFSDENITSKKISLVFKMRVFTIRQKLNFDGINKLMLNCIFYESRYNYLHKDHFKNFCKIDVIVEIASILHIVKHAKEQNDFDEIFVKSNFKIEEIIPKSALPLLSKSDWERKVDSYLSKNAYLKKQSLSSLKKKMLNHLILCPSFTSRVYKYKLKGQKSKQIQYDGSMVINIFGIFFYHFGDFSCNTLHICLEELVNLSKSLTTVKIEFMLEEKNDPETIEIISPLSQDIIDDILSSMLICLREKKRLFYSYSYIAKYIKENKEISSINLDSVTLSQIEKCLSKIKDLKETVVNLKGMPYTKKYNEEILDQEKDKLNQITLGGGFSIQSKRSFQHHVEFLKMTGNIQEVDHSEDISPDRSSHGRDYADNRRNLIGSRIYRRKTTKMKSQHEAMNSRLNSKMKGAGRKSSRRGGVSNRKNEAGKSTGKESSRIKRSYSKVDGTLSPVAFSKDKKMMKSMKRSKTPVVRARGSSSNDRTVGISIGKGLFGEIKEESVDSSSDDA